MEGEEERSKGAEISIGWRMEEAVDFLVPKKKTGVKGEFREEEQYSI